VVAMPLTPATKGSVTEDDLRALPRHACLLNPARGPLIPEEALLRALREGWIAGAALDVFDPEPPSTDTPLLRQENFLPTPHVAGMTPDAAQKLALSAAAQIVAALRGDRPAHLVKPQVWERVQARLRRTDRR